MELSWQDSLFDPPGDRLRRVRLDARSWLDVGTSWLSGHAELFDRLLADAPWQQRDRQMYDRRVLEPRLVAAWSGESLTALPAPLEDVRQRVGAMYGATFDSVLVNLYRDGRDSVAWHGDTVRHRLPETVVVTVGLGERRRFLLRPGDHGPATHTFRSGQGDLVVMGGRCQHEWQHTVPKETAAGGRMSVTMRHSRPLRRTPDA